MPVVLFPKSSVFQNNAINSFVCFLLFLNYFSFFFPEFSYNLVTYLSVSYNFKTLSFCLIISCFLEIMCTWILLNTNLLLNFQHISQYKLYLLLNSYNFPFCFSTKEKSALSNEFSLPFGLKVKFFHCFICSFVIQT